VARDLAVPGRELGGIHLAMSFLRGNTSRLLDGGPDAAVPIDAAGKDVIVVGGGDTGTDCVGTAIRQGAKSVRQLEILPRPPEKRAVDNPWPEWPKVYRMDYGQEEAKALWGEDPRRYSTTTRRFIGKNERVTGMEISSIEWARSPEGRFEMREVPGTAETIPADLVLLALGFVSPEPGLPKAFGCELDPRGNVRTGEDKMTSVPGVFAAGDCARGQSLVVWAIREGRTAAQSIDRYLMHGETILRA
jgi:glutamate synthase (NADPH/NADH) small chain